MEGSLVMCITLLWVYVCAELPATAIQPYTRLHPGRHVCTMKKESAQASHTARRFEAYRKPVYQSYAHRCHDKICRGVRVVYETAYRGVSETEPPHSFHCCPGWEQVPRSGLGCNSPVCNRPCQNGGSCVAPDTCQCTKGFTGVQCENDKDECLTNPCSQLCTNTAGSFQCGCTPGYRLATDQRSCLRRDKWKNKTLENKFDVEILARKVFKLEKQWKKSAKYELQTELSDNPSNDELQASLETLQKRVESMNRSHRERWSRLEATMDRLQPLCGRIDALERRIDQCSCKCKGHVLPSLYP